MYSWVDLARFGQEGGTLTWPTVFSFFFFNFFSHIANLKPWCKALPDLILCPIFLLQQERASFILGKKLIKGEESANAPGK